MNRSSIRTPCLCPAASFVSVSWSNRATSTSNPDLYPRTCNKTWRLFIFSGLEPCLIYATIIIQRSNKMGVNKQFKRALISAAFTLGFAAAGTASATNWLMAQGTEPFAASSPVKVWGFIQTYYQKDYSSASATGADVR